MREGEPCWTDVMVADAEARDQLTAFLGALFGWTFEVGGPETGYYTMAFSDGAPVAAVGTMDGAVAQFTMYLATEDLDATAAAVAAAGGQVFIEPMDVMDAGRMAIALDPTGAVFGMWQAKEFAGFGAANRPGVPTWYDHVSSDPVAAAAFYATVFGVTTDDRFGPGTSVMGRDADAFASFSTAMDGQPTAWTVVIETDDLAGCEERATAAGGSVLMSGMPVPGGRISALASPGTGTIVVPFQVDPPDAA